MLFQMQWCADATTFWGTTYVERMTWETMAHEAGHTACECWAGEPDLIEQFILSGDDFHHY